jgi:hypothetical protein
MNLAAVAGLMPQPETRVWFRAVSPQHLPSALATTHSRVIPSRFSAGPAATPQFEILYLAEDSMVALFEVGALLGSPTVPGGTVPQPAHPWVVVSVRVMLRSVVDLSNVATAQTPLVTSAQELTGDWRGYQQRSHATSVTEPVGLAPTQELGAQLHADPRIEGFITLSAKLPYTQILGVFPQKLSSGSSLEFRYLDANGTFHTHRIP